MFLSKLILKGFSRWWPMTVSVSNRALLATISCTSFDESV